MQGAKGIVAEHKTSPPPPPPPLKLNKIFHSEEGWSICFRKIQNGGTVAPLPLPPPSLQICPRPVHNRTKHAYGAVNA